MKRAIIALLLCVSFLANATGTAQLIITDGSLTGNGSTATPLKLTTTTVTAGSYTLTNLTVDAQGRLTAASSYAGTTCSAGNVLQALSSSGVGTCLAVESLTQFQSDINGTTGRSARFTGAHTLGTGAFTDDGTNATIGGTMAIASTSTAGTTLTINSDSTNTTKTLYIQRGAFSGITPGTGTAIWMDTFSGNPAYISETGTGPKGLVFGNASSAFDGVIDYDNVGNARTMRIAAGATVTEIITAAGTEITNAATLDSTAHIVGALTEDSQTGIRIAPGGNAALYVDGTGLTYAINTAGTGVNVGANGNLNVTGSTTLGDTVASDTTTINGNTDVNLPASGRLQVNGAANGYAFLNVISNGGAGNGYGAILTLQNTNAVQATFRLADTGSGTTYSAEASMLSVATGSSYGIKINTNATDNNGIRIDTSGESIFKGAVSATLVQVLDAHTAQSVGNTESAMDDTGATFTSCSTTGSGGPAANLQTGGLPSSGCVHTILGLNAVATGTTKNIALELNAQNATNNFALYAPHGDVEVVNGNVTFDNGDLNVANGAFFAYHNAVQAYSGGNFLNGTWNFNSAVKMNTNQINGLAAGTLSTDAANVGQITTAVNAAVSGVSGRVSVFNGTNSVTGYAGFTSDSSGNITTLTTTASIASTGAAGRADAMLISDNETGTATTGDGPQLHLENNGNNYNGYVALVNTATSPSFLDPKLSFYVQNAGTTGTGNVTDRLDLTNAGAKVFGTFESTGAATLSSTAHIVGVLTEDSTASIGAATTMTNTVQASERLRFAGQEWWQAANTSTDGPAMLLGINRTGRREFWLVDSASESQSASHWALALTTNSNTPSLGMYVTSTDGSVFGTLYLQSPTGLATTAPTVVGGSLAVLGGALNMNSHQINNVTDPSSAQDAATKNYVDGHIGTYTQILKASDQDVTNSTTLTDDTALQFSVTAGKIYAIEAFIMVSGSDAAGDYKSAWTVAAGTMDCDGTTQSLATVGGVQNALVEAIAAASTTAIAVGTRADASLPIGTHWTLACKVSNTTTLKYQFAENVAASTKVARDMAGSWIRYKQLN